jgi:hypothetical protein
MLVWDLLNVSLGFVAAQAAGDATLGAHNHANLKI